MSVILDMSIFTLFGYVGSFIVSLVMIPQVVKIYQIKHANQISSTMLILQLTGAFCFIMFAIGVWIDNDNINSALPIIIANTMLITSTSIILYFKHWKYNN